MELNIKEKIIKPWGDYQVLYEDNSCVKIKIINVLPFQKLSYQSHKKRMERWTCISGHGRIILNDEPIEFYPVDIITIPFEAKHRIEALAPGVSFIEVQFGTYLGEDDIIRYDDMYGRLN